VAQDSVLPLGSVSRVQLAGELALLAFAIALALSAGPGGLELLVIGAPNLGEDPRGDVEGRRDWWID
jgi:hypothetical protein